ncbi:MAG: thermonuclease family protein [Actinomycetota bacterium]
MRLLRPVRYRSGNIRLLLVFFLGITIGFTCGYLVKKQDDDTSSLGKEPGISEGSPLEDPRDFGLREGRSFEEAVVSQVIDGDTVVLSDGRTVRYLGIDTPEAEEPFYQEAQERNRQLVLGKTVTLQKGLRDVDQYGRILRYVYADGYFVNAELVAEGYASAYIFDPDDWYSPVLVQLEQYAKMCKIGMWKK